VKRFLGLIFISAICLMGCSEKVFDDFSERTDGEVKTYNWRTRGGDTGFDYDLIVPEDFPTYLRKSKYSYDFTKLISSETKTDVKVDIDEDAGGRIHSITVDGITFDK